MYDFLFVDLNFREYKKWFCVIKTFFKLSFVVKTGIFISFKIVIIVLKICMTNEITSLKSTMRTTAH